MSQRNANSLGSSLLFATSLTLAACADGPDPVDGLGQSEQEVVVITDDATCVTLYAGQTIYAGTVCAAIDNSADTSASCGEGATGAMNVAFETADGWEIQEAHLAVGDDLADIPTNNKGNPKIGNFPYHSGDISGATSHTFAVPLCELGLDGSQETCEPVTAYLAAHAAVRKPNGDGTYQTETGWGDGDRFVQRGSWAEYFNLHLECTSDEPPPPPVYDCETAFALGDECFLDIDTDNDGTGDFNRWGWRQQINESYSANLYAGAGQCDLTAGTLVGSLDVTLNGDNTITVTYNMGSGFTMDETHLYIGSNLPIGKNGAYTVAPGQYTEIHDELIEASSDSYTLPGGAGDYLIAHAVVCGDY